MTTVAEALAALAPYLVTDDRHNADDDAAETARALAAGADWSQRDLDALSDRRAG